LKKPEELVLFRVVEQRIEALAEAAFLHPELSVDFSVEVGCFGVKDKILCTLKGRPPVTLMQWSDRRTSIVALDACKLHFVRALEELRKGRKHG
jgi:hypothetical protein